MAGEEGSCRNVNVDVAVQESTVRGYITKAKAADEQSGTGQLGDPVKETEATDEQGDTAANACLAAEDNATECAADKETEEDSNVSDGDGEGEEAAAPRKEEDAADDEDEDDDETDSDAEYESQMSGLEYILTYKSCLSTRSTSSWPIR